MPDEKKVIFQLTARDDRRLEVRVTAPGGEAHGEARMPDATLLDEIAAQDTSRIPSAVVEKAGRALYNALVSDAVDEVVIDTLNTAQREGVSAQFELRFDADQVGLTRWPWEMIQNAQGQLLVRDGLVDLTRYITYPQPPPIFDESIQGMPLFRVISTPLALPQLVTDPLGFQPIETLEHASFEGFMRRLLIDRLVLWGLQFDGHGALVLQCPYCDTLNDAKALACWKCNKQLDDARPLGALAFEKDGEVNWIPATEFGSVLFNARVRLAMLLSCESAAISGKLVFSGIAPGLLLAGVPAVIGMQYPVLDSFANSFAKEFYAELVKTGDLLGAMRIARRMNMQGAWYSPALYLRRQPAPRERSEALYLTRNIDTAAPARVTAAVPFLTRLWIRRPQTKPLTAARLRDELDIPKDVTVRQGRGEAEIKFEPAIGRRLRRGEVEVTLTATGADVTPGRIKLFIDETLDAPPAIFTVRAVTEGTIPLVFNVLQDGGVIHTVTHRVVAIATTPSQAEIAEHSMLVDLESVTPLPFPRPQFPTPIPGDSGDSELGEQRRIILSEASQVPAVSSPRAEPLPPLDDLLDEKIAKEEAAKPVPKTEDERKQGEFGGPGSSASGSAAPAEAPQASESEEAEPYDKMTQAGAAHPMAQTFLAALRAYTDGDRELAGDLLQQCIDGGFSSPEVLELLRRIDGIREEKPSDAPPPPPPPPANAPATSLPPQKPVIGRQRRDEQGPSSGEYVDQFQGGDEQDAQDPLKTPAFDNEQTRPHLPRLNDHPTGGYQPPLPQQAPVPQAAPVARPVPAPDMMPRPTQAARKSGFPIWIVIGGLLMLLCLVAVAMVALSGLFGK